MGKLLFVILALQINTMNTLQPRETVRLRPHQATIDEIFRGKRLELVNAPSIVYLPTTVPKPDDTGQIWDVEIKDLGSSPVTIQWNTVVLARLSVGQTIRVVANGSIYTVRR